MSKEARRIQTIMRLLEGETPSAAGPTAAVGATALDDCAVVPMPPQSDLVVGTDFVRGEGFHLFRMGLLQPFDIGYYLIGANASDLAAMGAAPLGVVVVYRYSATTTEEHFQSVMTGVLAACNDFGMPLLGGDTGGYDSPVLSATAFGLCPRGKALLRSGASPGDRVYSTGHTGTAGAAIAYFMRAKSKGMVLSGESERQLLSPWKRVRPALVQARALADGEMASAAIDTSDGLKAACRQLGEASGVTIVLERAQIPVPPLVSEVATFLGVDAVALTVGDSVDFRLVFTASKDSPVPALFRDHGWDLFELGVVAPADATRPSVLMREDDRLTELPGIEWSQSEALSVDTLMGTSEPPAD